MVKDACTELDVPPERCVLIGDIGTDVEAAEAAGAHGVLVPTSSTLPQEIRAAGHVAPTLLAAVDDLVGGRW
jgi:beta-phosphoglucomutase-like phosphatase (HAD superfamily)